MILGSTLDMGVGPFLFFHTVNLVVQSLLLEYYTTKIISLPVILEIISLFKEQMVSHKRSTTFSNVENSCGIHACESLSKSVMDQNPLRTVLAGAFRFIHINVVDKFPQKWCSQRIHFHELSNRMDELIFPLCRKIQVIDFIAYSMNPVCKFHALYFGF